MRRGEIVVIAEKGPFTSKPRPAVVVQSDAVPEDYSTLVVCLIGSSGIESDSLRVTVQPTVGNKLAKASVVMTDRPTTIRTARARQTGGKLSSAAMRRVDDAIRRWLSL